MSNTPHPAPSGWDPEASSDVDLLPRFPPHARSGADAPFDQEQPDATHHRGSHEPDDLLGDHDHDQAFVEDSYERFTTALSPDFPSEYAALPGMPARGVVLLTSAAAGGVTVLDFALTGTLSFFFDLCFVVVCLVAAMGVRRDDIFATGVLPPLVFAGVIAAVAVVAPTTFVSTGGLSKVFLTGLAQHAGTLVAAYAVALAIVGGRVSADRQR